LNTNLILRKNKLNKEGKNMPKEKQSNKQGPTLAPGMNDQDELEQSASDREVEQGEFTSVTTLSYDEVDVSEK
jgi:hypothetical protein